MYFRQKTQNQAPRFSIGWKTIVLALTLPACCTLLMASSNRVRAFSRKLVDRHPVPPVNNTNTLRLGEQIYQNCRLGSKGLNREVLMLGLKGFDKLASSGKVSEDSILTIVDFSQSSLEKRMYIIDLKNQRLVLQTVVSHGKNSGTDYARNFSNQPQSLKSSLGFYITRSTYQGGNGYSLLLDGCEKGFNDNARDRSIVLHGAEYAEKTWENTVRGYIGRSFGCPAVPMSIHRKVIDKIKLGNPIFMYYPDPEYLRRSKLING